MKKKYVGIPETHFDLFIRQNKKIYSALQKNENDERHNDSLL